MSSLAMLRRSGPVALLIHAWRALLAILCTWPLTSALQQALVLHGTGGPGNPGDAALLLETAARNLGRLPLWSAIGILVHILITPLLAMLWLHAMSQGEGTKVAFARALTHYPRACLLGVGAGMASLLALAAGLLFAHFVPGRFPESVSAQTAARLGALALAAFAWFTVTTVHDRARASLASGAGGARSALRGGLRDLRTRDVGYRVALALACLGLWLTAELASRSASGRLAPWLITALQQAVLLPGTALQALWLAHTRATATRGANGPTRAPFTA